MAKTDSYLSQPEPRPFWKKRSVHIFSGLVLFIVLCIVIVPPIAIRMYLEKWLVENGADTATIEKVQLNPFTGVVALQGVDVKKDDKTVFSNSTVYFDIGLKHLLDHEAYIQQATLADVIIDIEISEDKTIRIGSYSIEAAEAEELDTTAEVAEKIKKDIPWLFKASVVSLDNVTIRYLQPDLQVEVVIKKALLEKFNNDPDTKEGALTLKGTVNGAPIDLKLSTLNIVPLLEIKGEVDISGVRLDDLENLLGEYLQPFRGVAGIKGKVAFSMTPDVENLDVHYDGSINLENGAIAGDGWATKAGIDYQGKASFNMGKEDMKVNVDGTLKGLNASFAMPDPLIDVNNADITISGKTTVTIAEEVVIDTDASLKLAPTTFAMDFLKTATDDMSWQGSVRVETGTDTKEFVVRADGKLDVAKPAYSMDMDGGLMEVGNNELSWDGAVEYVMEPGDNGSSFVRTDGALHGEAITFNLPGTIQLTQKDLSSKGKSKVSIGQDIGVMYQGDISLEETGVEMEGLSVGEKLLRWSGKADFLLAEKAQSLALAGNLETEGLFADLEEAGLGIRQKSLSVSPDFTLLLADSPSFSGSFSLKGNGLELLETDTPLLSLGEISMANVKDNGSGGVLLDSLGLTKLEVPVSEYSPVSVSIPSITLEDIASPDLAGLSAARLSIENPRVVDVKQKVALAELATITVENIQVNKDISVSIDKVSSAESQFMTPEGAEPMAKLKLFSANQINYSAEQGFSCDTIEFDSLFATIIRQKSEESQKEQTDSQGNETEQPDEGATATGIPVKIKHINVTGKSGLKFTDTTLTQTFMTIFTIDSLKVNDIDFNKPDQPFSYSLQGNIDKYSPLTVEGSCAPLAEDLFLEQQATLQNYSMPHISPYVVEAIGTYFPEGRLDFSSSLKLKDNTIDMQNNLLLKDLTVETVDGELAEQLNNQLPVSLDLALSMLRDSDGAIDIDIPIQGSLSSLHVGLGDIIITALGKGISVAVTPYLAYAVLGPTGALAFVGAKLGQSLLETNLPYLEYEPGETKLTQDQRLILDEVGSSIEDNSEQTYSICARVKTTELSKITDDRSENNSAAQNEAIRKELFELGEARSLAVRDYLTSKFKIDEKRLLICNPGLIYEEKEKSRVEFKE